MAATVDPLTPAEKPFEFGDPKPNAVGRNALVSSEGCVLHLDAQSADRMLWSGEDLIRVKLPAGTRVVYPKPTIPGLPDRSGTGVIFRDQVSPQGAQVLDAQRVARR